MSKLREKAALAALQGLISSTSASPEDLVADAVAYADLMVDTLASQKTESKAAQLDFEVGEQVFRPRLSRAEIRPIEELWQNTPGQLARREMGLITRDEMECIEMCKQLNLCLRQK